jgi:hypothetical protein
VAGRSAEASAPLGNYHQPRRDRSGPIVAGLEIFGNAEGPVRSATYEDGHWKLRFSFTDRKHHRTFYEQYSASVDLDVIRVSDRSNPMSHGEFGLAERQRDALITALEPGYFVVPREATTAELADELDASPQAVSQRLRRGTRNPRASTIGTQEPEEDSGLSLSPRWQDAS